MVCAILCWYRVPTAPLLPHPTRNINTFSGLHNAALNRVEASNDVSIDVECSANNNKMLYFVNIDGRHGWQRSKEMAALK